MATFEKQVWQDRWATLKTELTHMRDNFSTTLPRREAFLTLTDGLVSFADRLFTYYFDIFTRPAPNTVQPPAKYPKEFILRILLDQVMYDITVIQYAAAQRLNGSPILVGRLGEADKLAQNALQPAISANLLDNDTTALCYFTLAPRARVIPYATVSLVSLPLSARSVDRDYLATAHEIGHYIYWHGRFYTPPWIVLRQQTEETAFPVWCREWLEEIFADVYGAKVAGLSLGLTIQEILLDNLPEKLSENDFHHPVTSIRPYIYTKVLDTGKPFWARSLAIKWHESYKLLRQNGFGEDFFLDKDKNPVALSDAISLPVDGGTFDPQVANAINNEKSIDHAITVCLNALSTLSVNDWHQGLSPTPLTPEPDTSGENRDELYRGFTDFRENQLTTPVQLAGKQRDVLDAKLTLVSQELPATESVRSIAEILADRPLNEAEWVYLISAGGWVARGPEEPIDPWPR
jgi:hypothetical protein